MSHHQHDPGPSQHMSQESGQFGDSYDDENQDFGRHGLNHRQRTHRRVRPGEDYESDFDYPRMSSRPGWNGSQGHTSGRGGWSESP